MEAEVSSLPVVHLTGQKSSNRKENPEIKDLLTQLKVRSPLKSTACISVYKKPLNPLLGGPHKSSVKQQLTPDPSKPNETKIGQRVSSAKMLRLKQLQNQLADAHYHLNELANENRLLKALQKRQDSALKRYEGTNAELPRIINSHHEELRVLQAKYKKLKAVHKDTCEQLKERENEIQCLQTQNKHLSQLSKDRNLQEREKLQVQVSDLTYRIQQQEETIQGLQRKLSVESKSMKQQLQGEISKRKEVQKNLEETTYKLHSLENLLDNRDRRLYCNSQSQIPSKDRRFATQSLTNLGNISTSHPSKMPMANSKSERTLETDNMTLREISECDNEESSFEKVKCDTLTIPTSETYKTETMASLQQVRDYRLQKSSGMEKSFHRVEDSMQDIAKGSSNVNENSITKTDSEEWECISINHDQEKHHHEINSFTFEKLYHNQQFKNVNKMSLVGGVDPDYSSESTESNDECETSKMNFCFDTATASRALHARLISTDDEESQAVKKVMTADCIKNKSGISLKFSPAVNYVSIPTKLNEDNVVLHTSNETLPKYTCSRNEVDMDMEENIQTNFVQGINHKSHATMQRSSSTDVVLTEDDICSDAVSKKHYQVKRLSPVNESKVNAITSESLPNGDNENYLERIDHAVRELRITQSPNKRRHSNGIDKNDEKTITHDLLHSYNIDTINKLNVQGASVEVESVRELPSNIQYIREDNQHTGLFTDVDIPTKKTVDKAGTISYDKEKLLATMRAIDNNENIEFINQEYQKHNAPSRKEITENLFRGVPAHTKSKQDILDEIFSKTSIENKSNNNYSKLH